MPEKKDRNGEGKSWGRLLQLGLLAVTAVLYAPFVVSARYALFHGDDFSFCEGTFAEPAQHLLRTSLARGWKTYMDWQGTFLTNVLNPLLNPLNRYSFAMLKAELILLLLLAFAALLFLCREVDRRFRIGGKSIWLFAGVLLPLLWLREYTEATHWHVGAMAYLVPVTLLTLGCALMLRTVRKGSWPALVPACVLLFLSGGGVLLIGGFGACVTLLLFLVDRLENRKAEWRYAAAFLAVLAGDLVNVLAPGNYAKAGTLDTLNIPAAVRIAFKASFGELGRYCVLAVFLLALLVMFWLGMQRAKKLKPSAFALAVAGLVLTPVVTIFPYLLGYSAADSAGIAGRAWFVEDISLIVCWDAIAFLAGGQLSGLLRKGGKTLRTVGAVLAAALLVMGLVTARESMPLRFAENLRNGKVAAYSSQWRETFDMLSMRPGEIVVIHEQPEPCDGVCAVLIGARPDHGVNTELARYFGNAAVVDAWYAATYGVTEGVPAGEA